MTVGTMISAVCEVVGRLKDGQYGPYHPCKFKAADGLEFWKSYKPNDQELELINKGKTYSFVVLQGKGGKLDYKLINTSSPVTQPIATPEAAPIPTPSERDCKVARVDELVNQYAYVYNKFSELKLPAEAVQAFTSGVMIQMNREFPSN